MTKKTNENEEDVLDMLKRLKNEVNLSSNQRQYNNPLNFRFDLLDQEINENKNFELWNTNREMENVNVNASITKLSKRNSQEFMDFDQLHDKNLNNIRNIRQDNTLNTVLDNDLSEIIAPYNNEIINQDDQININVDRRADLEDYQEEDNQEDYQEDHLEDQSYNYDNEENE